MVNGCGEEEDYCGGTTKTAKKTEELCRRISLRRKEEKSVRMTFDTLKDSCRGEEWTAVEAWFAFKD